MLYEQDKLKVSNSTPATRKFTLLEILRMTQVELDDMALLPCFWCRKPSTGWARLTTDYLNIARTCEVCNDRQETMMELSE